jgi:hypothetical protein
VNCFASPIFNKRTAEAIVAAFALENSRILGTIELSVAIERLERFESGVVGRNRSQANLNFVEK